MSIGARSRTFLPVGTFMLIAGLTALFGLERYSDLERADERNREMALDDFAIASERLASDVESELDRLTELVIGIRAFTDPASADLAGSISAYLQATQTHERFDSLIGLLVVDAEGDLTVVANPSGEAVTDPRATLLDLDTLETADLSDGNASGLGISLTHFHETELNVLALTFPLTEEFLEGPAVATAGLVFDETAFLARALIQQDSIESHIAPAVDGANMAVSSGVDEAGSLWMTRPVDVFGSRFVLETTSPPGSLTPASRFGVYAWLAVGFALAIGLYLTLRNALGARSSALQRARDANAERAALDARFQASFELSPIGMAELDGEGNIVSLNDAMARQLGMTRSQALGVRLSSLIHESDREEHERRIAALLDGSSDSSQGEYRTSSGDREVWVAESVSAIEAADRAQRCLLVQSQDITTQRRAAWDLAQQALHDELTGLPNRALFLNRLKHALKKAERSGEQVAVMFIDVDRFKVINDSLGHEMGDELLVQFARRLGTATRSGDTVARFGGDEFVVLCESVQGESEALAVAQRIEHAVAEPFILNDKQTFASASIGITLNGADDSSADGLLRDADAAMYRAKDSGRARTELFDRSMRNSLVARMEIESQLRQALKRGELDLHYQAIVHPHTHQLAGFEALVRWNHPEKGLLGPGAFLPVAEEAGMIDLIDSFALQQSCGQLARWLQMFPATQNIYVSTNWSARHLGRFVQQVDQVLQATGVPPAQLVIEVTEGFLLEDTESSLVALAQLKALGVRVAIDDFGTGYSSLSYLTRFDVDFLKIDQSFVQKLPDDMASAAVIGAIADMANRLGIALVAEGVETDEQIAVLSTLGAPRMQGYRFAKPRPASDIEFQLAHMTASRSGDLVATSLS